MKLFGLFLVVACAGCQSDVKTPFPPGLEPLEDNIVPVQQGGAYTEDLRQASTDTDYIRVYSRGYILVPPGTAWAMAKNPQALYAGCSTDSQTVTPDTQPDYEFSFSVHYVVHNVVTIEWDDQWRGATITGTPELPTLAMFKHQKTDGSSFITLSEGTIQLSTTDDPNVTEYASVEHLDAAGGGVSDVLKSTLRTYTTLVAVAHGNPIPPCP